MTVLILTAYLAASPVDQRRFRIEGVSSLSCIIRGQEAVAEWAESHVGYVIQKWSCGR